MLEPAQAELDEAIAWYGAQVPGLGDAFLLEALKAFQLIERFPAAWHPLTQDVRRCRLRRFPYSVLYAQEQGVILVLAMAHQHRRPGYWRDRLKQTPPCPQWRMGRQATRSRISTAKKPKAAISVHFRMTSP